MKYVLASASPRRQELLTQAGFTFDVIPSAVDEKITKDIPSDVVMELAHQKALDVYESKIKDNPAYQGEDCIVIGADTIVSYRGEILGKPADNEEAFDMLSMLADRTHQVYTGVTFAGCIRGQQILHTFYEKTDVTFYPVTKEDLHAYVDSGDSLDKAGAYGIQGAFAIHVKGIEGDYNNVVGRISITGSTIFVILEIVMAVITRSQAVLLDSVYDGVEILMVFVSLSLVPLMYKPSSESHPFGYQQIESLFVVVKGAIMIAVTVGLIINNIQIIFHGGQHVNFSMVAYFEMSATLVSIAVIFLLRRMNSKLTSPIVIMEIQEWQIDSVASFGMCIAFFLPQIITVEWFQPLIPYLDPILAIILSLFMLPVPIKTVITGLRDLFLLPPEEETVQEIKEIVSPILATYGDTKLYYDILRTGRKLWISVYITMNRDMISISKFKSVQKEIIQALSKEYQDFYFELLPDIEYTGDTEVPEPVPDEEET